MQFNGRIGHLEGFESQFANAGGVAKTVEDVRIMANTGVAYIEDGSQPLLKRLGNAWDPETKIRGKDWDFDPETGEMHNSLGMPCEGYDHEEEVLPEKLDVAHAKGKKLIYNFAPVSDEPAEESLEGIQRAFAAGVDGVILNAGCPNVANEDGSQHELLSRNAPAFGKVLNFLKEAHLPAPIWVRLSPQESFGQMNVIANYIKQSGIVSAVLVPNTWSVDMPTNESGKPLLETGTKKVGKSGPAMKHEARKETQWAVTALKGSGIDVISSSSIMDAKELKYRIGQGAVSGAGTSFFYASENGWAEDVDKLFWDMAA